jgi:Holliday junction resolvase RusA-like endonuclease
MSKFAFTVYGTPIGQGSARAFVHIRCGKTVASVTHDNPKTLPYRQSVSQVAALMARDATETPLPAPRGVPVGLAILFCLRKPLSAPKRRETFATKKPDLDKLCRLILDSLTGIFYEDDAQVVELTARKQYGAPERTEIEVSL